MNYKHALFLFPYMESKANSTMKLFPPLGLEYVATSAKDLVEKITLLDLRYEEELCDPQNLLDFIRREIDIICVNITWDRQFDEILALFNKMPADIPLIVGGYKATERAQEILERCPNVTMVARGEGEETIREIFLKHPLKKIQGISYRDNGRIQHNGFRLLPDADIIPAPDRSLRKTSYYLQLNGIRVTNFEFDSVISARGCPFNCKFCTFNLNPLGQKRIYSPRSVKSVVDEIERLKADVILLADDEFFANKKRAEDICDLLIERNIKKRFIAQSRIDVAKYPRLLEKMVKAGFKALLIGIESPHDWILAQMDKGFDSQTIRDAFAELKKYPIYYHGYFIYGNIGETEEEMLYIPEFAKQIGVDGITFNKLRIEKFSALREVAEKTPGYHITDRGELYSDTYSHAALKKIGRKMRFSFYTPGRFMKMLKRVLFDARFFTSRELLSFICISPRLIASTVAREKKRGRLGDALKRTFVANK
ncbi:B12-binding domain-containing radical SAM protein [Candidatus Omnitrophota bacterium]